MYKKIVFIFISTLGFFSSFSLDAFANEFNNASGPYIGAQLGKIDLHYSGDSYTMPNNSVDDNKTAGRIYGGYNFSEFLAMEFGYDYFGKPEFKHPTGNTQEISQQGADIDVKISMPLNYGLGLYAKGGLALVHRDELESRSNFFAAKDANSKITPLVGAGLSFDFTPRFSTDVSFTRFASNGDLPKMDFAAFGIIYKFGSSYSTENGIPQ